MLFRQSVPVCLQRPGLSDEREAGTCRPRPLGTVSQWGVRRRARGSGSAAVQWASGPAPRPPNGRRPSATVGSGRAARPLLARGGRGGCGGGVPAGLRGERGRRRRRGGAGRVAKAAEAEARGGRRRRRPGWLQPLRPAESRAAAPRGAAVAWGPACLRLPGPSARRGVPAVAGGPSAPQPALSASFSPGHSPWVTQCDWLDFRALPHWTLELVS